MKFCYITDVHFRESTPINRKDTDILTTLEKKFAKLKVICVEEKIDFIVHGGDLGHNWDWKLSLLNRVDKLIKDLGIPFYSIIGNHDVPGKNILEYPNTGLLKYSILLKQVWVNGIFMVTIQTPKNARIF